VAAVCGGVRRWPRRRWRRDLVLDHVMDAQQLRATKQSWTSAFRSSPSGAGCRRPSSMPRWRRPRRLRDVERSITEEKVFAFSSRSPPWSKREREPDLPTLHHRALQPGERTYDISAAS